MVNKTLTKQMQSNLEFCKIIESKVLEYCSDNKQDASYTEVIKYLVSHNVIRQSMINRFMVIELYKEYLDEYGSKMKAVDELSKALSIKKESVYSILANHYMYFRRNRYKFP